MNRVLQEHKFGCGIACTAMIRGISYNEARDCFRLPVRICLDQLKGTSAKDVKDSLAGFAKIPRSLTPYNGTIPISFQKDCLLVVDKGKRFKNRWHWCVYDSSSGLILDPSPKFTTEQVMSQFNDRLLTINSFYEIDYIH